ncbi:MAG TPA: hypothetical protein VGJ05_05455 [Fimbriiglobus sp.]|jgi:hypothetical protein
MRFASLFVAAFALFAQPATAAFVVLANHTEKPVDVIVSPRGQGGVVATLRPGESRAFACGKDSTAKVDGKLTGQIVLEPYAAYVFVTAKGKVELKGIEFVGKPIPTTDVTAKEDKAEQVLKIPVRLLMDDANPFARTKWEPELKKRFREASDILRTATGVQFELAEVGEWKTDPDEQTLDNLVSDLEEKEKPKPGGIIVGYTCRKLPAVKPAFTLLGPTRGPLRPVTLIREGIPSGAGDQVEVLVHELAHYLGAVRIPDPNSVMRPTVGDGKANLAKFEIQFDPINVLLMNLWVDDLRSGKVKSWTDLRPETKARLARVYETIAKSYPDCPLASAYKELIVAVQAADPPPPPAGAPRIRAVPQLPRQRVLAAVDGGPRPPAAVQAEPLKLSNKEKAIRHVVRGITLRVVDNAKKPEGGADPRLKGDALTADLVRTAANVAAGEEKGVQLAAFAVGLGLALDDSTILRDNPLVRTMCRSIEPDADRKERIASLGTPTVRNRRDWCQHFAVSIALSEIVGPKLAEQVGVAKELADMQGTSGFSFADLTADFAGVEFYNRLKEDPAMLGKVKDKFTVADFVPDQTGVSDGLTKTQFETQFGSISDDRYKAAVAEVHGRIAKCPAYTK